MNLNRLRRAQKGKEDEDIDDNETDLIEKGKQIATLANDNYKKFQLGSWYPKCWLTFLMYGKPGGKRGKVEFGGGIATDSSSPLQKIRDLKHKSGRHLIDSLSTEEQSRKKAKESSDSKITVVHKSNESTLISNLKASLALCKNSTNERLLSEVPKLEEELFLAYMNERSKLTAPLTFDTPTINL